MLKEPLFLEPIFKERVWGGKRLAEWFSYEVPYERTGECWAISGHPHGETVVKNTIYHGLPLGQLWKEKPELFGHYQSPTFPILTKILDAHTDLSVQVHPDDEYAATYENEDRGKTECWYIIDCKEDAEIIYGHHAKTREEMRAWIEQGKWDHLLRRVKIKPGNFFYVPSGTIHALGAGTLVLETQQSSDATYRLYDYDRKDQEGRSRELHLEKAMAVSTIPHRDFDIPGAPLNNGTEPITLLECEYFTVQKWNIDSTSFLEQKQPFMLFSVLAGHGQLESEVGVFPIKKGDHFILPYQFGRFSIKGETECLISYP